MKDNAPGASHVGALDGVRGIAVLLVFLFHLRVTGFGSGFLGVDVFFVLSGFLITSLLIAEFDRTGRVAVTAFWTRRIRRLMPAVILLLFAVAVVTHLTATYSQRAAMRGDLLATSTYVANWHFIATTSYFNNTGSISPLQHTWSLGIEEQFYLVWPLLLVAVAGLLRRPRLAVAVLATVGAAASALALALLWSPGVVDRAYMGTDARIFEPLIGALGAVVVATPRGRALVERFGGPMVAVGVAGVVAGLALIHADTSVYYLGGAAALSICTLLVVGGVWLGRGGVVRRSLEWRPLAWLGVISYGVYLWHWPMLVWLGVPGATGLNRVRVGLAAIVLTIAVASASYYLIERPIRVGRRRGVHVRLRAWQRQGVLLSVPMVIGAVAFTSVAATAVPRPKPGVPVVMLTGDSVPLRLQAALERDAGQRGWRVVSAASGGCPVTGEAHIHDWAPETESTKCPEVPPAQDALIAETHPQVILWWDRWSLSAFFTTEGHHLVMSGTPQFWKLRAAALAQAVDRLTRTGAMVVFVATEPPGKGMTTRCGSHCDRWIRFQIEHYADITTTWNGMMKAYADEHPDRAAFVSITDVVCHTDVTLCDDTIDGVPARPDGTHYEGPGETLATSTLLRLIAPYVTPRI